MMGPGKYDDLTKVVKEITQAKGILIIVLDGVKGNGSSCKIDSDRKDLLDAMPAKLRKIADAMDKDHQKLKDVFNQ